MTGGGGGCVYIYCAEKRYFSLTNFHHSRVQGSWFDLLARAVSLGIWLSSLKKLRIAVNVLRLVRKQTRRAAAAVNSFCWLYHNNGQKAVKRRKRWKGLGAIHREGGGRDDHLLQPEWRCIVGRRAFNGGPVTDNRSNYLFKVNSIDLAQLTSGWRRRRFFHQSGTATNTPEGKSLMGGDEGLVTWQRVEWGERGAESKKMEMSNFESHLNKSLPISHD